MDPENGCFRLQTSFSFFRVQFQLAAGHLGHQTGHVPFLSAGADFGGKKLGNRARLRPGHTHQFPRDNKQIIINNQLCEL